MHRFGIDDSGVSAANLNSLLSVYDAVVATGVSAASGDLYGTISAAIAAGHRSIVVTPGTYTEDVTIASNSTRIEGVGPLIEGATGTREVVIAGQITVGADLAGIELRRLHITPPAGKYAIYHNSAGRNCYYEKIYAWNGDSNHFEFNTRYHRFTMRDCRSYNCGANAYRFSDNIDEHGTRGELINCGANGATGCGFSIGAADTDNSHYKEFTLLGCHAVNCAESYGAGFQIGKYFRGALIACIAASNVAGSGFYFYNPGSAAFNRSIVGCQSRHNGGYGFARESSGHTASEAWAACVAYGNTSGQWANFGSIPTTCV